MLLGRGVGGTSRGGASRRSSRRTGSYSIHGGSRGRSAEAASGRSCHPRCGPRERQLRIVLRPERPTSPRAEGWSSDDRQLGVALWTLQLRPQARYAMGQEILFTAGAPGVAALWSGWSEPDAFGTRSVGSVAELLLSLEQVPEGEVELCCWVEGLVGPAVEERTFRSRGERDRTRSMAVHAGAARRPRPDAGAAFGVDPGAPTEDRVAARTADLTARGWMVLGRPPAWRGIADAAASPTSTVCDRTGNSVHSWSPGRSSAVVRLVGAGSLWRLVGRTRCRAIDQP